MPLVNEQTRIAQHGTWIEIYLDRLLANVAEIKRCAGSGKHIMAVVKANAYGHGLLETAKALEDHVNYLGVSSVIEALEIQNTGIDTPVFLFGRLLPSEVTPAILSGATLCVSSFDEAFAIADAAKVIGKKVQVHIKVDTGMGRLGIPLRDARKEIQRIRALRSLTLEGIFTHFPSADSDAAFTEQQVRDFALLLSDLESHGITFPLRHAANSSGSLHVESPVLNMIRPGIMLYGIYPETSAQNLLSLAPVLSLKSRVVALKVIQPGESVGYGRRFIAQKKTNIGILPMGYSHGYPVHLSGQGEVLYQGKKYKVAGRVSMDYTAVDFEETEPAIGEEVVVIGSDGPAQITAEDLAARAGTIPYEIVTRLPARLPRFYF